MMPTLPSLPAASWDSSVAAVAWPAIIQEAAVVVTAKALTTCFNHCPVVSCSSFEG